MKKVIRRLLNAVLLSFPSVRCDLLGYSSHSVDTSWILSTLIKCKKNGMEVAFAYSQGSCPEHFLEQFKDAGIKVFHGVDSHFMQRANAPVVLTASSGLPKSFFSRKYCRYRVHMPHSISSLHMIYPKDAFDGYNVLFAVGPHHEKEFHALTKLNGLKERAVYKCGYSKAGIKKSDYVYNPQNPPHVLLAPSWGKGNILETIGTDLVSLLLDKGYKVSVRPHPAFFIDGHEVLDNLKSLSAKETLFRIEDSRESGEAIYDADIMISDYSGVVQEFFLTAPRPIVFVDVEKKVMNEDWESLDIEPIELRSRNVMGPLVEPDAVMVCSKLAETLKNIYSWVDRAKDFEKEYLYDIECAEAASLQIKNFLVNQ